MSHIYDSHPINTINDQFTLDNSHPDPTKKYYVDEYTQQKGLTLTMKFVLLSKQNPDLLRRIVLTDVNATTNSGWTALMIASISSTEKTVEFLLENKSDVNKQNKDGMTALMHASKRPNNESTIKLLLEYKSNVNLCDEDGWTALMIASRTLSNEKTITLLLEHKSDVNKQTESGWTALMVSVSSTTIKALIQYGADVNMQSHDGMYVIEHHHRTNRDDACRLLTECGAMFDKINEDNMKLAVMKNDMLEKRLKDKQNWNEYCKYITSLEQKTGIKRML